MEACSKVYMLVLLKVESLPTRVPLMICLLHSGGTEAMPSLILEYLLLFPNCLSFLSCCRLEVFEGPSFDDSARHFAVPKYPQNINIHSVGSTYFHFHISVAYSCRNHPFGKQSSDY